MHTDTLAHTQNKRKENSEKKENECNWNGCSSSLSLIKSSEHPAAAYRKERDEKWKKKPTTTAKKT